jgi:hypothetical protein
LNPVLRRDFHQNDPHSVGALVPDALLVRFAFDIAKTPAMKPIKTP